MTELDAEPAVAEPVVEPMAEPAVAEPIAENAAEPVAAVPFPAQPAPLNINLNPVNVQMDADSPTNNPPNFFPSSFSS